MGTIYSIASFVGGILSPVTGFWVDRYGGRVTIALLTIMFSLSFLLLSYSTNRYTVCFGFMAIRFSGIGGMAVSSASVVAKWFEVYRGRAMGVLTVVASLLNSGTSVALRQSVQKWGWRAVFQGISAFGCVVLFPLFALFVRSVPEDMFLLPDGRTADQPISRVSSSGKELDPLQAGCAAASDGEKDNTPLLKANFTLLEAARTPVFWVLIAGSFLNATIAGGIFFHVSIFLSDNGLPGSSVQDVFLPYGITQAISSAFFGWVLDRFPMKLSLAIGYVIQAFALLSLYYATSRPLAIITGCLLGANGGCLITCFRTVCCPATHPTSRASHLTLPLTSLQVFAACFGRKHIGAISSFNRSVQIVGTSVGPVSLALVRDSFGAGAKPAHASFQCSCFAKPAHASSQCSCFATPAHASSQCSCFATPAHASSQCSCFATPAHSFRLQCK
jgi:MFS family permease